MRLIRPHSSINPPYGGTLINLLVSSKRALTLSKTAPQLFSLTLTQRQCCDVELLINGGFSPLTGFMGKTDYESVCASMRLSNGMLWPVPITLDVPAAIVSRWRFGQHVALRDYMGTLIAILTVTEIWRPDKQREARQVFGTMQESHPEVDYLYNVAGDCYVAGKIEAVQLPAHEDFTAIRKTPMEIRRYFLQKGYKRVIGYHARHPLHRAHVEFSKYKMQVEDAALLIHAVAGKNGSGERSHHSRLRAYEAALEYFPPGTAALCLSQLYSRMCGPREGLWHAILQKNFGCSHIVVEHDIDGLGDYATGAPIYGKYETQTLIGQHEHTLGIQAIPFQGLVYEEDHPDRVAIGTVPENYISADTESDSRTPRKQEIADWFSYPQVLSRLEASAPVHAPQGITVFLTGLIGAGKSTIAAWLMVKLMRWSRRSVTLLDNEASRKQPTEKQRPSRELIDEQLLRAGHTAAFITMHQGIVVCAAVAPYSSTRAQLRQMVQQHGAFIEAHVATPLGICETRDKSGLYIRARAGKITHLSGVTDPYEMPRRPDIVVDTQFMTAEAAAEKIIDHLVERGLLSISQESVLVDREGMSPDIHRIRAGNLGDMTDVAHPSDGKTTK